MTRRRLTARLCFAYVRDSPRYLRGYVWKADILPRLPGADRRERRRRQQLAEAWALVQEQMAGTGLIFSMPQIGVVPAREPTDGDDPDSDQS